MVKAHVRRVVLLPDDVGAWLVWVPDEQPKSDRFVAIWPGVSLARTKRDVDAWRRSIDAEYCEECLRFSACAPAFEACAMAFDRYDLVTAVIHSQTDKSGTDAIVQWIASRGSIDRHGIPGPSERQKRLLFLLGQRPLIDSPEDVSSDLLRRAVHAALLKSVARLKNGSKQRLAAEKLLQKSFQRLREGSVRDRVKDPPRDSPDTSTETWSKVVEGVSKTYLLVVKPIDKAKMILGIKVLTENDLRVAYRAKVFEHHPDRGGTNEQMVEINAAYEVLTQALRMGIT